MKKYKSNLDPTFARVDNAIAELAENVPWKDVIPTVLKMLQNHQPKEDPYTLDFWLKAYNYQKKQS